MKRVNASQLCFAVCLTALLHDLALAQTTSVIDTDRDGIVDTEDPCPLTPPGAIMLTRGCAAVDVAAHPSQFLTVHANELTASPCV